MPDLTRHSGDLGGPSERLGPQPEPRGLVGARCDADGWIGAALIDGPAKRRPHVRDLVVHEAVGLEFPRTSKQFERGLGLTRKEDGVSIAHGLPFAALGQALFRELPLRVM